MLDRSARINRHLKANKQTLKKGLPANSEGANGDITIREIGTSTQQFVKKNGAWAPFGSGKTQEKKTVIVKSGGSTSSSLVSSGSNNHSDLSGLDTTDDHTQYMHNSSARTVSANHNFTGSPAFSNIDINGGDIASGTTINKSPVVNFNSGDVQGSITLSNLASGTGSLTIQNNSVDLGTHTTGNYMAGISGNSQISVSHTPSEGSSAALSIAADSIGDSQLEYNTGQHLTTSSSPTFNTLTTDGDILVKGDDISSHPFTSGFTGSGWKLDNTGHLEVSNATIRGTLSVYELLLQQLRATNGNVMITSVAKVESVSGSDITFEDPSNNGVCPFHTNDIVMVQRADLTGSSSGDNGGGSLNLIKRIVRRVSSVSGKTITVANDVSGAPSDTGSFAAGDDVVRIGNTSNTSRDALLYLSADDSKAPYIVIKDGVASWSNFTSSSTEKARLGRLDGITDTDAGLDGNQTNSYGLYSSNVHLKGHIFATSGKIGGINLASSKIYTGTGSHNNSNTGFYIDNNSNFSLGNKLSWDGSSLSINGNVTVTNTSDFAPSNATANDTDANLKNRSNHTGTQGASSLDSTVISGGKIITGLLTADNIQTGTLTGRTVTVTHDTNLKTEISPTRAAKSFDNGTTWYNYPNILTYEFTSSGGMDLIAFKATWTPGFNNWVINNHYFLLDGTSATGYMADNYIGTVLTRYTKIYPIASLARQSSGSGWYSWSPSNAHQSITTLVTDQSASGTNIKQVRFNALSTHATPFNSGTTYKVIFLTEIYN